MEYFFNLNNYKYTYNYLKYINHLNLIFIKFIIYLLLINKLF